MDDKQWLERIKRKKVFETGFEQDFIRARDLEWLVQRIEVLEKENEELKVALTSIKNFVKGTTFEVMEED